MNFITIQIIFICVCAANASIQSYEDLVFYKSKIFSISPKITENQPKGFPVKIREPIIETGQQEFIEPVVGGLKMQNVGMHGGTQGFETKESEAHVIQTEKFTSNYIEPEVNEIQNIQTQPLDLQYYISGEFETQEPLEDSGAQNYQPVYVQNHQPQEIESQNYPGTTSKDIQTQDVGFPDDQTQEGTGFQNIHPQYIYEGYQLEEGTEPEVFLVSDSESQEELEQKGLPILDFEPSGSQLQAEFGSPNFSIQDFVSQDFEPSGSQLQEEFVSPSLAIQDFEPSGSLLQAELGAPSLPIQEYVPQDFEPSGSQLQAKFGPQSLPIQDYVSQDFEPSGSQLQAEFGSPNLPMQELGSQDFELQGSQSEEGYGSSSLQIGSQPQEEFGSPSLEAQELLDSQEETQKPQTEESESEEHVNVHSQKPWVAPLYHKALEDFDHAVKNIQKRFKQETYMYEDDQNFRFLVIVVVTDGLSKIVSEKGWDFYDNNYEQLVKSLSNQAVVNPKESVDEIRCVFRHSIERINGIRKLINNKWNRFICKAQPSACDIVLYGQLRTSDQDSLRNEAKLLLKLGDAASTYLSYEKVFEAVSDQSSYQYVMKGRDAIREQVKKNAIVRDILYPNGGPSKDECS